jgi:hypothetical protein
MCDDTAVRWSNYDTVRSTIEYETRFKIANEIQDLIDKSKLQGISNHFISGLEISLQRVLGLEPQEKDQDASSVLF